MYKNMCIKIFIPSKYDKILDKMNCYIEPLERYNSVTKWNKKFRCITS